MSVEGKQREEEEEEEGMVLTWAPVMFMGIATLPLASAMGFTSPFSSFPASLSVVTSASSDDIRVVISLMELIMKGIE